LQLNWAYASETRIRRERPQAAAKTKNRRPWAMEARGQGVKFGVGNWQRTDKTTKPPSEAE